MNENERLLTPPGQKTSNLGVQDATLENTKRFTRVTVGRRFCFSAAHFLHEYEGKCAEMHGHNYVLEVEVSGPRASNGLVVDFGLMKEVVTADVLSKVDHKCLNDVLATNPTVENLVVAVWDALSPPEDSPGGFRLESVKVWETENCWARVDRDSFYAPSGNGA